MLILDSLDNLSSLPKNGALSIGNFDGLHLGHQSIIRTLKQSGLPVTVVTFEPHPLTVLKPELAPPRLMNEPAKLNQLRQLGVDHVVLLRPVSAVLNLSAREFYEVVRDYAKPKLIAEGKNFCFGKARQGTIDLLGLWCQEDGIELRLIDDVLVELPSKELVEASSSLIRWLLLHGRTREANACLGYPYPLQGTVVRGHARGRTIGFPTANLDCGEQLIPADGVYHARSTIAGKSYAVALSVGTTPTFNGNQRLVEAHLLNFSGDLYGQSLTLEIFDWVREQQKFRNKDELVAQLARDIECIASRR